MIKAILFDLDGTLANSLEDLADSTNIALEQNGFPIHTLESYKYFVGNGIQNLTAKTIPEELRTEENCRKVYNSFMDYYRLHFTDKTKPYNGIAELIESLKSDGYKIAVVTNKSQEMAEKVAFKLFGNVFETVVGKREDYPAKPDPTLTLKVISELGVKPAECVFIGDSGVDAQTAVNVGCKCIGVLWGFRTKEELTQNGADYTVDTPQKILEILKDLNNEQL